MNYVGRQKATVDSWLLQSAEDRFDCYWQLRLSAMNSWKTSWWQLDGQMISWTDRPTAERTAGRTDGHTDGRTDERMDGQMSKCKINTKKWCDTSFWRILQEKHDYWVYLSRILTIIDNIEKVMTIIEELLE